MFVLLPAIYVLILPMSIYEIIMQLGATEMRSSDQLSISSMFGNPALNDLSGVICHSGLHWRDKADFSRGDWRDQASEQREAAPTPEFPSFRVFRQFERRTVRCVADG